MHFLWFYEHPITVRAPCHLEPALISWELRKKVSMEDGCMTMFTAKITSHSHVVTLLESFGMCACKKEEGIKVIFTAPIGYTVVHRTTSKVVIFK